MKTTLCGAGAAILVMFANYQGPNNWKGYLAAGLIALQGFLSKDHDAI